MFFLFPFENRSLLFQFKSGLRIFWDMTKWLWYSQLGMCLMYLLALGLWPREYDDSISVRNFFNEKLMKYLPVEYGGNFIFPFSDFLFQYNRVHPKTQWSSFEQRSFFPHTDKFKAKLAVCHEDYNLLNTLLDRNFDINQEIEEDRKLTPLALASYLGKHEMAEFVYSRGGNLESKDREGNTPLLLAVINNHPRTVKKLIDLGADLAAKDFYGFGAYEKAQNRGNEEMASLVDRAKQVEEVPLVKPFTYGLENYEFLGVNWDRKVVEKYDIRRYYKPQLYPFYRESKGYLLYLFTGVDLEDIELHADASVYYNKMDDRLTSDQDLFTFGKVITERANAGM